MSYIVRLDDGSVAGEFEDRYDAERSVTVHENAGYKPIIINNDEGQYIIRNGKYVFQNPDGPTRDIGRNCF